MRRLKEILRLKWSCGLSHRQISGAVGVSVGAISQYAALASAAGLDWPTAQALDDDELERRLVRPIGGPSTKRIEPECALIHQELRRKGVTFQWFEEVNSTKHFGWLPGLIIGSVSYGMSGSEKIFETRICRELMRVAPENGVQTTLQVNEDVEQSYVVLSDFIFMGGNVAT